MNDTHNNRKKIEEKVFLESKMMGWDVNYFIIKITLIYAILNYRRGFRGL
jgi:hypothetical protein